MPTYSVIPQATYDDKSSSQAILKYVKSKSRNNKKTGIEYLQRLSTFEKFIKDNYNFSVDELTIQKVFNVDIYDLLDNYVSWLSERRNNKDGSKLLSPISIKNRVINAKNFLEYYDIIIIPHKFRSRVNLPRVNDQDKEALTKNDIIRILNACPSLKLKTYLICLAVTGARASEMCSIRLKDIKFKESKIEFRAEHTKTKKSRYCFITDECADFLHKWIEHKYRRRRLYLENIGNRWVTPNRRDEDLVFSSSFTYDGARECSIQRQKKKEKLDELDLIGNLYTTLVIEFNQVIKQLGIGYEDHNKNRHIFTLHSFRRYLRTLLTDVAGSDFAGWVLGHSISTYWRKSEAEKYAMFRKASPHLVLLDQTFIENKSKDMESRLETMEVENRELRQNIHKIMEMIGENPKLAKVKSEVLIEKEKGKGKERQVRKKYLKPFP